MITMYKMIGVLTGKRGRENKVLKAIRRAYWRVWLWRIERMY